MSTEQKANVPKKFHGLHLKMYENFVIETKSTRFEMIIAKISINVIVKRYLVRRAEDFWLRYSVI